MKVDIDLIRRGEGPLVLWVSRHGPLPAEIEELERVLKDPHIVKISGKIPNAEWLTAIVSNMRKTPVGWKRPIIIVPVLPLSMIKYIVEAFRDAKGIEVWWTDMETIGYSKEEPDVNPHDTVKLYDGTRWRVMRFKRFERIKEVRIVTEPVG